jgi:hypothetical protein
MSTEDTSEPVDRPTDRHDDRTFPAENDLPPIEPDESAGWREEFAGVHCDPDPDPEDVTSS